jgi:hypothetical protein
MHGTSAAHVSLSAAALLIVSWVPADLLQLLDPAVRPVNQTHLHGNSAPHHPPPWFFERIHFGVLHIVVVSISWLWCSDSIGKIPGVRRLMGRL